MILNTQEAAIQKIRMTYSPKTLSILLLAFSCLILTTGNVIAKPMSAEKAAENSVLSSYCVLRLAPKLKTKKDISAVILLQSYTVGLALIAGKKGINIKQLNNIKKDVMGKVKAAPKEYVDNACAHVLKAADHYSKSLN